MSKSVYRHTVTDVVQELDDDFVTLFPGAFERVEEKAADPAPAKKAVEPAPAATKKTDSSKEGNN